MTRFDLGIRLWNGPGAPQGPAFVSATVNGTSLVATFSGALKATNLPAGSAFAVTAGGASRPVTGVAVSGSTLTLTLGSSAGFGAAVLLSYTDPTAGNDTTALQGASDDIDVASFGPAPVTNSTPEAPPITAADLFAVSVYSGNATARSIPGVDMTGGGLHWSKGRSGGVNWHRMRTVGRGFGNVLYPHDNTTGQLGGAAGSFTSTGITFSGNGGDDNLNGYDYVNWFFKEAAGFHASVRYTGNGVANRAIAHPLGVKPGVVIVRRVDAGQDWDFQHHSLAPDDSLWLNSTSSSVNSSGSTVFQAFPSTAPDSSVFRVGAAAGARTNVSGVQYEALLFAHDPSGFIQCGSVTTGASGAITVSGLPGSPQFLLIKKVSNAQAWVMLDKTRGWGTGADRGIQIDTLTENTGADFGAPTADGFTVPANGLSASSGETYVYMVVMSPPVVFPVVQEFFSTNVAIARFIDKPAGATLLTAEVIGPGGPNNGNGGGGGGAYARKNNINVSAVSGVTISAFYRGDYSFTPTTVSVSGLGTVASAECGGAGGSAGSVGGQAANSIGDVKYSGGNGAGGGGIPAAGGGAAGPTGNGGNASGNTPGAGGGAPAGAGGTSGLNGNNPGGGSGNSGSTSGGCGWVRLTWS